MITDLSNKSPDKFIDFWKEFGQCLKEGFGEDFSNKEKLAELVRFKSSTHNSENDFVSLNDYIARMKQGQEKIYVITGESTQAVLSSPHLEIFKKKDIEVLLLTDRVDEWVLNFLNEYEGKAIQSITKGTLDLDKIESKETKDSEPENMDNSNKFKLVIEKATKVLGSSVKEIRLSNRLTDSACCLISDEHDVSGHLERLLKSAGQNIPERKPILEINPKHPLVEQLLNESEQGGGNILGADGSNVSDGITDKFSDLIFVLFDQALLAEGGQLQNPSLFVKRLNGFLLDGLRKNPV
jgi:molecular chaperone HtpG